VVFLFFILMHSGCATCITVIFGFHVLLHSGWLSVT